MLMRFSAGRVAAVLAAVAFLSAVSAAQRPNSKQKTIPKTIFFAVLDDGKSIEPIGVVSKGKFIESPEAESVNEKDGWAPYFSPTRSYSLIFGGSKSGTVSVVRRNLGECSGTSAEVAISGSRVKVKGFVMALATNSGVKSRAAGFRRLPTSDERAAVEELVRAEYKNRNLQASVYKDLRYFNLTALDLNQDGSAELVGSFWAIPKANERARLFFVASKASGDKYEFEFSDFELIKPEDVMSGDVKDLDEGIGHELLLDYFDIDGDGTAELFTTVQGFEGRNFSVYHKNGSKWEKVHESYNYRCGY